MLEKAAGTNNRSMLGHTLAESLGAQPTRHLHCSLLVATAGMHGWVTHNWLFRGELPGTVGITSLILGASRLEQVEQAVAELVASGGDGGGAKL